MESRRQLIADKMTPTDIQTYRKHFEMYDLNGDGVISATELWKVSKKLGYMLSQAQVKEIMKLNDLDENGCLTFDEFLMAMPGNKEISRNDHRTAELRRIFLEYDSDGNGAVTMGEAHQILQRQMAFTPKQSIELVRSFDKNNDGHLSYEEFVEFYRAVQEQAEQIREVFEEYDADGNGSISVDEARTMLGHIGMPEEQAQKLVLLHDKNQDGELQYDEFVAFVMTTTRK